MISKYHFKIRIGRLYTSRISHFAGILRMILGNAPQTMKHSLHSFRISCEFRVLLIPRKNKSQNPLTFRANAEFGTKCCEKQKKGHETRKK